jgi:hypothetical protein
MHGVKWLFEPSDANSGFRNSQMTGISEHFEFEAPTTVAKGQRRPSSDYLYKAGASVEDLWNGTWGILRSYRTKQDDLLALPNNPAGGPKIANPEDFDFVCPKNAPVRDFEVVAVLAQDLLPEGTLVYNSREANDGPLHDPTAILYVRKSDLDTKTGQLKAGVPVEPLILRANAGDCIKLRLENWLPEVLPDLDGFSTLPMIVDNFNANQLLPSSQVGLHPQLVALDVGRSDGANVGFNVVQTAESGTVVKYQWYAGDLSLQPDNSLKATPIEFGAINLSSSDPIKHSNKGAIGGLIIEPQGATWVEDAEERKCGKSGQPRCSRAAATVTLSDGSAFREFVVLFQNDINLRKGDESAVELLADTEDPEDSGQKAVNYRTEPMWHRFGFAPDTPLESTRSRTDLDQATANALVGGDPETPVFTAEAGMPVRLRVLHPAGHQRNNVFQIHGHIWEEEPYTNDSTQIGSNPVSQWEGAKMGHGPSNHFDAVLKNGAGGKFGVTGDYLWRDMESFSFDGGTWGLLRVK